MFTTVTHTTDNARVLTSGDSTRRLFIIDHAEVGGANPGEYLTAYTRNGDGWKLTVDYFHSTASWAVYALVDDDEPLTTERLAAMLEGHEDAQGIADHLNSNPLTERLNAAIVSRRQSLEFTGEGREVDV